MLVRRVGEALDRMNAPGTADCPDAEVLAAYAEQSLGADESGHWEGHFASCARCRNILRVLAASTDTPLAAKEVAHLGELVSSTHAPDETAGRPVGRARPWYTDWRMRWLAPAFGVAAVLAAWFAIRPPWRATRPGASETLVAQAPKEEAPLSQAPAELDRASRIALPQEEKSKAAPSPNKSTANAPTFNSPVEGLAKERGDAASAADRISLGANEATSSLQQQKKLTAQLGAREIQPPAVPPPPPPPQAQAATGGPATPQPEAKAALGTPAAAPLPQARAQANAAPAPETPASTGQSVTVTESVPQVGTTNGIIGQNIEKEKSKDRPVNGRDFQALIYLRPAPEFLASLKAPSGSIVWRAGKDGVIQRSTDSGNTWDPQKSPSKEDWLAGVAVSDKICWLVGRNGAIARTTDGMKWKTIKPPQFTAPASEKLSDWVGITANGAQDATITGGDQRRYSTKDGGRHWQAE